MIVKIMALFSVLCAITLVSIIISAILSVTFPYIWLPFIMEVVAVALGLMAVGYFGSWKVFYVMLVGGAVAVFADPIVWGWLGESAENPKMLSATLNGIVLITATLFYLLGIFFKFYFLLGKE